MPETISVWVGAQCGRSTSFFLTMTLHWAPVFLLSVASLVASQSSNVTCDPSFEWTANTRDQSPCLVSSYLQSLCGRNVNVNTIPPGTHYLGPTSDQASPCSCSSVVYSLTSACGMCQGRTIVNWTAWTDNCPETFQLMGNFPRQPPDTTEIPAWAYLNITNAANGGSWDQFAAKKAFDDGLVPPTSSALPEPSQVTRGPSSDTPLSSASSETASTRGQAPSAGASNETAGGSSNAGAIAGGVVGGLVGLVGIGLLVLWLLLRKKRKANAAPPKDFVIDEPTSTTAMLFSAGNSTTMSPPPMSQRTPTPYSSNIQVTSPQPPPPAPLRHHSSISDMYTTLTTRRSQESFNVSQYGTHVPPSIRTGGAYRGAPEV